MSMERIGFGNTAVVYKYGDGPVAVKKFFPRERERCDREMEILKNLNHPYIVQFYRYIAWEKTAEDGAGFGFLMELGGKSLFTAIADHENMPLSLEQRQAFAFQITSGLAYVHRQRIVHRDIQPSNILIFKNRKGECVKIVDFGSAEMFSAGEDVCWSYTKIVYCNGAYTAPEIRNATSETLVPDKGLAYGPLTDTYSFGKVLWALITNSFAFEAEVEQPKRPENYTNDLYWGIMQRFWSPDPARRIYTPQFMEARRTQLEALFTFGK